MIVIPPITITPAMVVSSTIAEPDTGEAVWVSGASYTLGQKCILLSTHKVYQRVVAGAGTTAPNLDLTNWVEVGPTNRWAMFDIYRNSPSVFNTATTVVLAPGSRVDSIAIMGARISDVSVSIEHDGEVIYTYSAPMQARLVVDYYDYFYADFNYKNSVLMLSIPPVLNPIITITTSQQGSISSIVIGRQTYIGMTRTGHTNDALNFSVIDRDIYGTTTLIPRRNIPRTSQEIVVHKKDVNDVLAIRNALRASPAVWSGLDDDTEDYFEALLILGIYKEMTISLDYPEYATCTLELEEI